MYLNKKEIEAVRNANEMINNLLEGCTADEETEEGKLTIRVLNETIGGLESIEKKYFNQIK